MPRALWDSSDMHAHAVVEDELPTQVTGEDETCRSGNGQGNPIGQPSPGMVATERQRQPAKTDDDKQEQAHRRRILVVLDLLCYLARLAIVGGAGIAGDDGNQCRQRAEEEQPPRRSVPVRTSSQDSQHVNRHGQQQQDDGKVDDSRVPGHGRGDMMREEQLLAGVGR